MSEIKLNQEMISALQKCKDAKAVIAFAKSRGVEMSEEQAGKLFAMFQNDKLIDEDLEKVTGGGCGVYVGADLKSVGNNHTYEKGILTIPIG